MYSGLLVDGGGSVVSFLPSLLGTLHSADGTPRYDSISPESLEVVLPAFCFLVWLPAQSLLLPGSWKKIKVVKGIPSPHS